MINPDPSPDMPSDPDDHIEEEELYSRGRLGRKNVEDLDTFKYVSNGGVGTQGGRKGVYARRQLPNSFKEPEENEGLMRYFNEVDLLEHVSHFLDAARENLAPQNQMVSEAHKAANFYCVPLQFASFLALCDSVDVSGKIPSVPTISVISHKRVNIPYSVPASGTPYKSAFGTPKLSPAKVVTTMVVPQLLCMFTYILQF
ncbi:hypothetical protein POM88_021881 [Heracleum sosnowskyi]|uniref:Uncharacterized protein n=1 Tax=Heracleum sosnowskyi TaxID=360622 RepID=A0AAD8IFR1_9APIA|nr:hypothetical protein POM88_021881 [Heracleum sosnowskyi]